MLFMEGKLNDTSSCNCINNHKPNKPTFETLSGASLRKIISFSYEGSICSFNNEIEMIKLESFAQDFDIGGF